MKQCSSCLPVHFIQKVLALLVSLAFSLLVYKSLISHENVSNSDEFPFRDITKATAERVDDLIARLDLQEKIQQLGSAAPEIPRLGIPSYDWWSEALHGVALSEGVSFDGRIKAATSFPQTILTAASFNDTLFNKIGQVVSTEARAMYNTGQSYLTFWSPNVNIFRDPRWGRGHETPGEDPRLSSNYAVAFVRGMQQVQEEDRTTGSLILKTSACCKHFTAYDLEKWGSTDRDHFDASVTEQDLEDTFNPPFESCIKEGAVSSIMCAYTRINGIPMCGSKNLLSQSVRRDWGFDGYIVSDCDAVYDMTNEPAFSATLENAVADSLEAGLDLNCGITYRDHAELAIKMGKVNLSHIDSALFNLFTVRMRLGMFDGDPQIQTYGHLDETYVCTAENQALALEAALQGIVLLKNDKSTLPLSLGNINSMAVLGPSAHENEYRMLGNYYGIPCTYVTPLQGLARYVSEVTYHSGCPDPSCTEHDFSAAEDAARKADAVVMVMGLSILQEGEGIDRVSLRLPGHQQRFICSVAKVAKGPIVLVIMSGGPVDVSFAKEEPRIQSILWVGYPGQAGGMAIADIIFGAHNPEGKLPLTWYPESFISVPMTKMNMRPNSSSGYPGRTYRFYTENPVFEFGYGLSYTTFNHEFVSAPSVIWISLYCQSHFCHQNLRVVDDSNIAEDSGGCDCNAFQVTGIVRNTGSMGGTSVVQLFSSSPGSGENGTAIRSLIAYQRVYLEAGNESDVTFSINLWKDLSTVGTNGERHLELGEYVLSFGNDPLVHGVHKLKLLETQDEFSTKFCCTQEVVQNN